MKIQMVLPCLTGLATLLVSLLGAVPLVLAHCDTMEGPVIKAAQKALETGDINLILIWVQKKDEEEIKAAFKKALEVRNLSPAAKEMADTYFFESLVRIHRAGEGAPYTGIKPKGTDIGVAVSAADKAIGDGKIDGVLKVLDAGVKEGVTHRFRQVLEKKNYNKDDVEAGREFVEAYVVFTHYVEGIYNTAKGGGGGHHGGEEAPEGEHHR